MNTSALNPVDNPRVGIAFICFAMLCITINDTIIKGFSETYALHQVILLRSALGIGISLTILQFEGGFSSLRTKTPLLHLVRALCLVAANMAFFAALAEELPNISGIPTRPRSRWTRAAT